jgi:hypothetical protein
MQASDIRRQFGPINGTTQARWTELALEFMEQKYYEQVMLSFLEVYNWLIIWAIAGCHVL